MKYQFWFMVAFVAYAAAQIPLPRMEPLNQEGDLAAQVVDGINDYLLRETVQASRDRDRYWHRDFSSANAYERTIETNRRELRRIIGAVDERVPAKALESVSSFGAREK